MKNNETSNTSELKHGKINQELQDWKVARKSKFEEEIQIIINQHELYQELHDTDDINRKEQILSEIRENPVILNSQAESLIFAEFAIRYREYKSDMIQRYGDDNSCLISVENQHYVICLYRRYLDDEFDDVIKEYKKVGDKQARQGFSLVSFDDFEKWLFYHASSLCYHRGIESASYDDINAIISTKPYGDSSLYPQNDFWQILFGHGEAYSIANRDYCCDIALKRKALKSGLN